MTPFLENPTFDLNAVQSIPSKSRQGTTIIATKSGELNRPKTSTGFRGNAQHEDTKSGAQSGANPNRRAMQTLEEKSTP
jgi:hypothetical protein